MEDPERPNPLQPVNEALINVRNEAIVQAANLYLFGRKVALIGVGLTCLSIDATQAFAQRAIDRGEIAEADAQRAVADMQQQTKARVKAADQARIDATEKATAALLENTNGLLKMLKVPPLKVVFPAEGGPTNGDAPAAPPPEA